MRGIGRALGRRSLPIGAVQATMENLYPEHESFFIGFNFLVTNIITLNAADDIVSLSPLGDTTKENEMNDLNLDEVGITELSMEEIDDVSGGVLCLLVLAFVGGYGVGTAINKMMK